MTSGETNGRKKIQKGVALLEDAVEQFVIVNPGLVNTEIADKLGMHSSDNPGGDKNYLSWYILQVLVSKEKI